jgi:uncharacterized protein (TIGR00369 family)
MNDSQLVCRNPNFEADIRERLKRQFFMKLMGFDLSKIELGRVEGRLDLEEKHMQQNYFVHGGVVATAADIVMGFAAYSTLPENHGVVTVDLSVQYLHPGIGDALKAIGKVVKAGNNISFCEAEIWVQDKGAWKLTNTARATMYKVAGNLHVNNKAG